MKVQIQKNKLDQAVFTYRESVLPEARRQPGFQGATLLTDRATGAGLSITLWESEADMLAGERTGYLQEQLAKFAPLFASAPEKHAFEVAVATLPVDTPLPVA